MEKLAFCHDTFLVVSANAKTFTIVFIIANNGIQSFKNIFYPVSLSLKIFSLFNADMLTYPPPHTHTSLALPILLFKIDQSAKKSKKYADIWTACIQNGQTTLQAIVHGRAALN